MRYIARYTTSLSWKETVFVPEGRSATVLGPAKDCTGIPMVHHPILEHGEIGMMGVRLNVDGGMPPMDMKARFFPAVPHPPSPGNRSRDRCEISPVPPDLSADTPRGVPARLSPG